MDSWCRPVKSRTGKQCSGGAARQVRIAAWVDGMDDIIKEVSENAIINALEMADKRVSKRNIRRIK